MLIWELCQLRWLYFILKYKINVEIIYFILYYVYIILQFICKENGMKIFCARSF